MTRLAIFASGSGSNAVNIIEYFHNKPEVEITKVYCNNPKAGILNKANALGVKTLLFNREEWKSDAILSDLKKEETDVIALAGFLWLIPTDMVAAFPDRILNIHPSLLPKYGGKGMYGSKVHEAVVANKESQSGITIHLVNEKYDDGGIVYQESVPIQESDTPEEVASKVLTIEHANYARVIEEYIQKL